MRRPEPRQLGVFAVVGLALALRLAFVLGAPGMLIGDALFYHGFAGAIARGYGYVTVDGSPAINWVPGWPLLLAGVFKIFGDSVRAGMIANAVLGAATAGLLVVLVTQLFDRRVGLVAGCLYAVWPGNVYFAATLMTEVAFNFFLVLSLAALVLGVAAEGPKRRAWVLSSGLSLGFAALVKAEPLVLTPVYLLFLRTALRSTREFVACAAFLSLAIALPLAPWTMRNYLTFDRLIVTSGGGGETFWKAHHPGASGANDFRAAIRYRSLHQRATTAETTLAVNAAGWRDGWHFIRSRPGEELRIGLRKLEFTYADDAAGVLFAGGMDGFEPATRRRLVAIANGFWYGVMALAALGLATVRSWPASTRVLVLGVPVVWLVLHLLFLGGSRYHIPETPSYALLAACGIGWMVRAARGRIRSASCAEGTTGG